MLSHMTITRSTSHRQAESTSQPTPAAAFSLGSAIEMMGATVPYRRDSEIYGENEPAEYLYKVISGAVRTYKILTDGRRQIGSFCLPGDIFGLEVDDIHTFSAEAITNCKILVIKRSALVSLAGRDIAVARRLWTLPANELQRAQEHILLLIKTAQERVVGFLIEMSARSADATEVELPMSRQDIADYLGLTIETVSRTLTRLENIGAIAIPTSRRVVLRSRGALNRLNA